MIRIAIILLLASAIFSPAHAVEVDLWNALERDVLGLVNSDRAGLGLRPLAADGRLQDAADAHSSDMAQNGFFGHTGSGGTDAGDRIAAAGYAPDAWGENIAAGFPTAESVVGAWLDSPGHRAVIESAIFTDAGVGYVEAAANADFETYWTLVVAAGDSAPARFPMPARFAAVQSEATAAALAPIPLPSAFWLLLTALATGLALIRRRHHPG
jgi:uncharacterized protein YkwD